MISDSFSTENNSRTKVSASLVVGADGAFSALRRAFMRRPLFDFSQQYIEHGYLELCIPPSGDDSGAGFAMAPNYLHIWPRGTFMMIALPNQDCSWTVTLFAPFADFQQLHSPDKLLQFFYKYFPDAVPLIGKDKLVHDFFAGSPSALVAVKCRPYNAGGKALLIGDAAHAVVPFYGQGMNAGFEDCMLLDQLMQQHEHEHDHAATLASYSETRWADAHAVSDLAMYNYVEMRDLVNRRSYILRKKLDDLLFWLLPDLWVPLYNSVTFSHMPYAECIKNRAWQDQILTRILYGLLIIAVLGCLTIAYFKSTIP